MALPFSPRPLEPVGLLHRLLRRGNPANAVAAIETELAHAERIADVSCSTVTERLRQHRVRSLKKLQPLVQPLYAAAIRCFLADGRLDERETRDLRQLKRLLAIREPDRVRIHREVAVEQYGMAVEDALKDGVLSDGERARLRSLQQSLEVPMVVAQQIYQSKEEGLLDAGSSEAATLYLTPQEQHELRVLADDLGLRYRGGEASHALLELFRRLWMIHNADLPVLEAPLPLKAGEECYFASEAGWHEYRGAESRRHARSDLADGIYWEIGDLSVQLLSEDVLKHVDTGVLCLTNRRLLFKGDRRSGALRLATVCGLEGFKNGVRIDRTRGRSVFLELSDVELFAAVLGRALRGD